MQFDSNENCFYYGASFTVRVTRCKCQRCGYEARHSAKFDIFFNEERSKFSAIKLVGVRMNKKKCAQKHCNSVFFSLFTKIILIKLIG